MVNLKSLVLLALVAGNEFKKPDPITNIKPMKIMVSMTFGSRSHIKNVFEIGKELQKRGHSISYMTINPYMKFADGYNFTRYKIGPNDLQVDDRRGISEMHPNPENPLLDTANALLEHLPPIYRATIHEAVEVVDLVKPDAVICDFFSPSCIDAGYLRKIPVITGFQTLDGPILPPSYITGSLDFYPTAINELSFPARFYNTIIHPLTILPIFYRLNYLANIERVKLGLKPTHFLNVGNWDDSLKICNTFTGFELARPFEPTMKLLGPIMSDEYAPLTNELSQFLNNKNKVVYIAFGSGVVLSPKDVKVLFEGVTHLIESGTADGIIWALGKTPLSAFNIPTVKLVSNGQELSSEQILHNQHPKIQFVSWAPQVAILEHNAVRVFLSHGGLESVFEAAFSGTPILAMPYFGDQYRNARKIVELGIGGYTDRFTHTAQSIHTTFKTILDDKDGKFNNAILHWQVIARVNSKKKSEAADLVEQLVLTSRICRNAPGADPNASPPCEIAHLVPGYQKMNYFLAMGYDVYGALAVIILIFFACTGLFAYNFIRNLKASLTKSSPVTIINKKHQ